MGGLESLRAGSKMKSVTIRLGRAQSGPWALGFLKTPMSIIPPHHLCMFDLNIGINLIDLCQIK